jgi:hypothetical protein
MNVAAMDEQAPTRDPPRAANATITGPVTSIEFYLLKVILQG